MARNKPSKLRANIELLTYLQSIPPRRQKLLMKGADLKILEALSEICWNLVHRNVKLTPQ